MTTFFDLTLPTPLHETAVQFLLFFTFIIHLVFVLLMLGTAILSMYYFVNTWWGSGVGSSELNWDKTILRKFLPVKAIAVIIGVAPLLLVQVYYSVPFLAATSLHAVYWMLIIPFLIFSLLLFDAIGQRLEMHRYHNLALGIIALTLLLAIPGAFVAIVITLENPNHWIAMAQNGGKLFGILSVHWLLRYFHILGAAIVFGAGFHYWFSAQNDFDKKRLLYWLMAGVLFQIIGGGILFFSIPKKVSFFVPLLIGIALLPMLALIWSIFVRSMQGRFISGKAIAVMLLSIITPMLLARQYIQNDTIVNFNRELQANAAIYNDMINQNSHNVLTNYTKDMSEPMNNGNAIFHKSCSFCHGSKGAGNGPSNVMLEVPSEHLNQIRSNHDYIYNILLQGVPGTGMPNFRFYDHEKLQSLMDFMDNEFGMNNPVSKKQESESGLDLKVAQREWEQTCAVCHAMTGEGSVLGKQFMPPPPDFTKFGLTPERAFEVITNGYPRTMMFSFKNIPKNIRHELVQTVANFRK